MRRKPKSWTAARPPRTARSRLSAPTLKTGSRTRTLPLRVRRQTAGRLREQCQSQSQMGAEVRLMPTGARGGAGCTIRAQCAA
jgi:hypothetical protein